MAAACADASSANDDLLAAADYAAEKEELFADKEDEIATDEEGEVLSPDKEDEPASDEEVELD